MAKSGGGNVTPSLDAGLGLIYRLNYLWAQVDAAALAGDFERWNFILDRIYVNLLYRNALEVVYNEDETEIVDLKLDEEDVLIHGKFKLMLKTHARKILLSIRNKNKTLYHQLQEEKYDILMMKDAWLRKVMQEKRLYLRETNFNPANAMWGG